MAATLARAVPTCKCRAPTNLASASETDRPTKSAQPSPLEMDATTAAATRTEERLARRTSVHALRMASLTPSGKPLRRIATLADARKPELSLVL